MTDVDEGQLRLATLTRLWLFPRYLYRIGDKALSSPINLRVALWAVPLVAVGWILSSFGPVDALDGAGAGLIPRLIIPGLLVWLITTKITQGARPWEVTTSWARLAWHRRHRPTRQHPTVIRSRSRTP